MKTHSVYALILAGGSGTRFWPASRHARPKQFLALLGSESLLAQTVRRARSVGGGGADTFLPMSRILIAGGRHLEQCTLEILPELPPENMLAEPAARNTAPCIAWAAMRIARRDPDAIFMVLPSDHFIADEERFREVLEAALEQAAQGSVTTIGIHPTHPETGYGYIQVEADEKLLLNPKARPAAYRALGFVEKPERAKAEQFLQTGHYFWNAGMFFFRVKDMLDAVERLQPALYEGLKRIEDAQASSPEQGCKALEEIFPTLPSVSIDKGIMEHLDQLSVVPGDFGWSDLGSWQSAWEFAQKDANENALPEGAVAIAAHRNLVVDLREHSSKQAKKRVIAMVGVNDMVVVETDDALLVVAREQAQQVRDVVEWLKTHGGKDKL